MRRDHSNAATQPLPLLAKLLPYYLDCVRADGQEGACHSLKDIGKTYLLPPFTREWCLEEQRSLTLDLGGSASAFAKALLLAPSSVFYGYPLYVDRNGFALPVFLLPVECEQAGATLQMRLELEWPRVNADFLMRTFATAEEQKAFMHDMGLLESAGDPPGEGLAFFGRRLRELGVVPEVEAILPELLGTAPDVPAIRDAGLYNRSILALGRRSTFTAGLEHELQELQTDAAARIVGRTVLRRLFGQGATEKPAPVPVAVHDAAPVEVVRLNDEQRGAVRSAFENTLTLITGPPGTGKSQVVVTLLANAYLRGERVLFASHNHKAVDIVIERMSDLSRHPLVVRSGTRSGERNLPRRTSAVPDAGAICLCY